MRTILVTGGTGTVGRPTVAQLQAAGHQVRVLSRNPGSDLVTGDLGTGEGLAEAVDGADVVVHLATSRRKADVAQTKNLLRVLEAAGTRHLVVISIVGVDQNPMAYYRAKLEIERLVAGSAIPFTLLRATQFHELLDEIFAAQRFLPLLLAPRSPCNRSPSRTLLQLRIRRGPRPRYAVRPPDLRGVPAQGDLTTVTVALSQWAAWVR